MIIAIVGGRDFTNKDALFAHLDHLDEPFTLVSGGAKGADSLAEDYAKSRGIYIEVIKPQWKIYGKAAGFIRNQRIISKADTVVACWNGSSKGTQHGISLAKKANKPILIIHY